MTAWHEGLDYPAIASFPRQRTLLHAHLLYNVGIDSAFDNAYSKLSAQVYLPLLVVTKDVHAASTIQEARPQGSLPAGAAGMEGG